MIVLSKEQLLLLHEQLIKRYGGAYGVRDESLLDSALILPLAERLHHCKAHPLCKCSVTHR